MKKALTLTVMALICAAFLFASPSAEKAASGKTPAQLDAIKACVRRLETLPDVRELTALL